MTKEEFIFYVKGILDSEKEKSKLEIQKITQSDNNEFDFIGPLKLIKEALETVDMSIPTPNFPFGVPNVYCNNEPDKIPYNLICSCNPENGGSGICGCTMANQMIPNPKK